MQNIAFILFFLSSCTKIQAVSFPDPGIPLTMNSLVAEKEGKKRYYILGQAISIRFKTDAGTAHVKGYLTRITEDSIEISSFGGSFTSQTVAISSMESINRVNRKTRKTSAILFGITGVIVGILAIASKGTIFNSAWGFALIGIPAIAIGWYMALVFGFSFLDQAIMKRSVKKGWRFYAGDTPPKKSIFPSHLFGK
jgi:ABC-type dipeptide/oligopeptide/nickel transport system permease component